MHRLKLQLSQVLERVEHDHLSSAPVRAALTEEHQKMTWGR